MNIVLDTNIIRRDFMMRSAEFLVLFDYLNKTNSSIRTPEIVFEEILTLFRQTLAERIGEWKRSAADLQRILPQESVPTQDYSVDAMVDAYRRRLEDALGLPNRGLVPYEDRYLREVVHRAINRIRPFSQRGEEFRDALLWLAVLDVARESDSASVIFISNNVKEFAAEDKVTLHQQLVDEATHLGVTVQYYPSLGRFIEHHASRIDFLTLEWLQSAINLRDVEERTREFVSDEYGQREFVEWLERRPERFERDVRVLSANPQSSSLELENFYVYELSDGSEYVRARFSGEIEVEFEVEDKYPRTFDADEDDDQPWHWSALLSPREEARRKKGHEFKFFYPEIAVEIDVKIESRQIVESTIACWEFP